MGIPKRLEESIEKIDVKLTLAGVIIVSDRMMGEWVGKTQ